jgi:hypothetical protein
MFEPSQVFPPQRSKTQRLVPSRSMSDETVLPTLTRENLKELGVVRPPTIAKVAVFLQNAAA